MVITILGLALPQTSFSETSPFSVLIFVEKYELEGSNVAVVKFTLNNNSEKSIELTDKVYLTDSKNNHIPYSITNLENTSCVTDIPIINSNIQKNIELCFEIPIFHKKYETSIDFEKYNLVLEHSGITESIPLYLYEHQLKNDHGLVDLKKMFVTIHRVNIIGSASGDTVVIELSIYNGDEFSLPLEGKGFFIVDSAKSNGGLFGGADKRADLSEDVKDKCLDIQERAYPKEITTVTMCFERPLMGNNQYDTELFLTVNENRGAYSCENCQEKIWNISPYLSMNNVSDSTLNLETNSQKIPSWVKDTMQWYLDGAISEDEMINAIQFLVKNNIIDIS